MRSACSTACSLEVFEDCLGGLARWSRCPPGPGVRSPSASARSTADSTAAASASIANPWRSISAADRNMASGLATPCRRCPAPSRGLARIVRGPRRRRGSERSAREHPDRAGQHRRLVAEDVAEHVLGHDHLEVPRRGDQLHRGVVDQQVLELDVGELAPVHVSRTTSRHRRLVSSTLALSTLVTRDRAAPNATRAIRSISSRV